MKRIWLVCMFLLMISASSACDILVESGSQGGGENRGAVPPESPNELKQDASPQLKHLTEPTAEFQNVWLEHDVWEGDSHGMRVHADVNLYALLNIKCQAVAYFFSSDGQQLKDFNGNFSTPDGYVAVSKNFTPQYEEEPRNLVIFIPYEELHMGEGVFNLKSRVSIWWLAIAKEVGVSDWVGFQMTNSSN